MAEVTIPDYSNIDQTTVKLSQIQVFISTIGENEIEKRAFFLPFVVRTVVGYVANKVKKPIIRHLIKRFGDKIEKEAKEIERSALLRGGCELWYNYFSTNINPRSLPPCPCKKSQADQDDRFEKEGIVRDLLSYYLFNKKKALGGCYSQSNVG